MTWSEGAIAAAICRQTLQKKCIVLVDRCNWTGHECDVLGVTMNGRIIDIEIKISRSDLVIDIHKDKWWHYSSWMRHAIQPDRVLREHPPRVWKHYYAFPAELWKPELVKRLPSPASGIILMRESEWPQPPVIAKIERRAKPAKDAYRMTPEQMLDVARLANLRMWDAYAELDKTRQAA
jgi:hypothetical protein